jgi:N6-L-threonylcarbamoyladenine synthase
MIKLNYYAKQFNINTMVIGGGCSANQLLQDTLTNSEFNVLLPETKYTGDNAAMIAWYSY